MKITKSQLTEMIREAVSEQLNEQGEAPSVADRIMNRLGYSGETDEDGNPTVFFDINAFLRVFDIEETGVASGGYFYITFIAKNKKAFKKTFKGYK